MPAEPPASADPAASEEPQAPAEPPPPATPEQRRFLAAVEELESSGGAWDPGLAQYLLGLGATYQLQGRHEDAVRALSRAAHVTRINEGLYSTSDIPIVERLIESQAALGEWEAVSGNYQQLFQIQQRNYGERDPRMLPVLRNLSSWHLRAWMDAVGKDPLNHLIKARDLYDYSLGILRESYGPGDTRLADTLRERAIVDYFLALTPVPATPPAGASFGTGMIASPQLPEGPATYVVNGFISGRDALEQVVELRRNDTASSPVDTGSAIAELADWHLLFGRRQTAMSLYRDAQSTLAQAGEPGAEATRQLFGAPIELPVKPSGFAEAAGTAAQNAYILVNFSVDERGKPSEPEVMEADPTPPESQLDRLRKHLRFARFRPRFEGAEPVATSGLSYRFRYSL
jgi:tetratricopeptide (TPR) repeat protein